MEKGSGEDEKAKSRELVMSAMNLSGVRKCALDLRQQIEQLYQQLLSSPADLDFKSVLQDFGVARSQHAQLQGALRSQLRFYVAHPMRLPDVDQEVVTEQLSSMVLPEMSAVEEELLQAAKIGQVDDASILTHLKAGNDSIVQHNKALSALFEDGAPLHPKSVVRKKISNNLNHNYQKALHRDGTGNIDLSDSKVKSMLAAIRSGNL